MDSKMENYPTTMSSDDDEVPLKLLASDLKTYSLQHCKFCEKVFMNRYDALIHNAKHMIVPLLKQFHIVQCLKCHCYFASEKELKHHIHQKHADTKSKHKLNDNSSYSILIDNTKRLTVKLIKETFHQCTECLNSFTSLQDQEHHFIQKHSKNDPLDTTNDNHAISYENYIAMSICNKDFMLKDKLDMSQNKTNGKPKLNDNPSYSILIDNTKWLTVNLIKQTFYECHECLTSFTSLQDQQHHIMQKHSKNDPLDTTNDNHAMRYENYIAMCDNYEEQKALDIDVEISEKRDEWKVSDINEQEATHENKIFKKLAITNTIVEGITKKCISPNEMDIHNMAGNKTNEVLPDTNESNILIKTKDKVCNGTSFENVITDATELDMEYVNPSTGLLVEMASIPHSLNPSNQQMNSDNNVITDATGLDMEYVNPSTGLLVEMASIPHSLNLSDQQMNSDNNVITDATGLDMEYVNPSTGLLVELGCIPHTLNPSDQQMNSDNTMVFCHLCNKGFDSDEKRLDHIKQHLFKTKCPQCELVATALEIQKHQKLCGKVFNNVATILMCDICCLFLKNTNSHKYTVVENLRSLKPKKNCCHCGKMCSELKEVMRTVSLRRRIVNGKKKKYLTNSERLRNIQQRLNIKTTQTYAKTRKPKNIPYGKGFDYIY